MPKKLISEQQVVNAANLLANSGKSLTLAAIRIHLGAKGSNSTIHKYLKKWKHECFKQGSNQQNSSEPYNNYMEGKRILEQTLNKKTIQNEHYAQELINTEKTNISLKEEIYQLKTTIQELQLNLSKAAAVNATFEQVTQKIQHDLNLSANATIQNMQQTIDDLRTELKKLNEQSLAAVRDTSITGHEALMQERVTNINLQAKIDSLTKELIDTKKQLNESLITVQVQNKSSLRQIEWMQKIIQEHIGTDQLAQTENVDLDFKFHTTIEAETLYGK